MGAVRKNDGRTPQAREGPPLEELASFLNGMFPGAYFDTEAVLQLQQQS